MSYLNLIPALLSFTLIGGSGASLLRNVSSEEKSIYETSVLEDLRNLDSFDENAPRSDFEFLYLSDYRYSMNNNGNYDLFMYFYVKNEALVRNLCYAYLGIGSDNATYFRQDLVFRSYEDGYCKVSLPYNERTDFHNEYLHGSMERVYRLSSINVLERNNGYTDIKAYDVSRVYTISGFSSGIYQDEGNMEISWVGDKTVSIDVKANVWSSEPRYDLRNNVFYAYFDIPEDLFVEYGTLKKVHYSYEKVLLNPLFNFINGFNYSKYNNYGNWKSSAGFDHYLAFAQMNPNLVATAAFLDVCSLVERTNFYSWDTTVLSVLGYNQSDIFNKYSYSSNRNSYICFNENFLKPQLIFNSNNYYEDFVGENVVQRFKQYPNQLTYRNYGRTDVNTEAADFGSLKINRVRFLEYPGFLGDWRNNMWGFTTSDKVYRDDAKIWEILDNSHLNDSIQDFSDYYFVNKEDVSNIKERITNNSTNHTQTVILRYGNEFQEVRNIFDTINGVFDYDYDCVGVASLQFLYKDFQVIDFTFEDSGVETVIGVIHDPITTTPDIPGIPHLPKDGPSFNWKILVAVILGILIIALLIVAAYYLMPLVYQFLNDPVRIAHRQEKARRYTEWQSLRRKARKEKRKRKKGK